MCRVQATDYHAWRQLHQSYDANLAGKQQHNSNRSRFQAMILDGRMPQQSGEGT